MNGVLLDRTGRPIGGNPDTLVRPPDGLSRADLFDLAHLDDWRSLIEQRRDWASDFDRMKRGVERERDPFRFYNLQLGNVFSGILNPGQQSVVSIAYTGTAITSVGMQPDYQLPGAIPAGTVLRLTAWGIFTSSSTPSGPLTMQFMYGGTGGTSLYTTGSVTLSASQTGQVFSLEAIVRIISSGAGGANVGQFISSGRQQGISTSGNIGVPVQSNIAATTINTNTANTVIVTATSTSAMTSLTIEQFLIEQLN